MSRIPKRRTPRSRPCATVRRSSTRAVLHDPATRTYGAPDFLVRSNVLDELFPGARPGGQTSARATGVGGAAVALHGGLRKVHDLHLQVSGQAGNDGSAPAYKQQLYVYNRALGRVQGHTPETAYLLGRGWTMRRKGAGEGCANAMDRLGPVTMDAALGAHVEAGVDWVRRLRADGGAWTPLPLPSVPELWPNMKETGDFPWEAAKSLIAKELEELTLLWYVGPDKRNAAHRVGIMRWTDPQ